MSTHTYYQAIDEESSFFRRMKTDHAFRTLLAQLTVLGPGPFHDSLLDPSEVEDTLEWLTEQAVFASMAQAGRVLGELREEIKRVIADDPGIEQRSAYIEQVHDDLETRLTSALDLKGVPDVPRLIDSMMYGAVALDHEAGLRRFRLVPTSLVAKAASVLEDLDAHALYSDVEEWDIQPAEDYEKWKWLYLECRKFGQAILVLLA